MPSSGVKTCALDRKSTRLNSSHGSISYAVFCLKKTARNPTDGYYSYDLSSWHIIVLSSHWSQVGGCSPSSAQGQWLRAALAVYLFFLMMRRPPGSPLFPTRALFR